jgi:hypothetical protein
VRIEPLFWGGVVVYDETFKPRVLSSQVRERFEWSVVIAGG